MKPLHIPFLFLMLCALFACETEIPFDGTVTDEVLVVNCLACSDSVLQANISVSRFFLEDDGEFPTVTNATVALYVNGAFVENLTNSGLGLYKSNFKPVEGDTVRLTVSASGYEPVWAEVGFPIATKGFQIDSTITKTDTTALVESSGGYGYEVKLDTVGVTYSYTHKYQIRFSDPPQESNFYRLIVREANTYLGYTNQNYLNNFDDIVFGTKKDNLEGIFTESEYDQYNIFSDELIDGKTHTITLNYDQSFNYYYNRPEYKDPTGKLERSITIDLQTISKSYYLYLKSLKALAMADPFMSEPVQVYTNVQGGLGIMGSRTNKQRKFVLPE